MKYLYRLCLSLVLMMTASSAFSQTIKTINLGMTEVPRSVLDGLGNIQINTLNGRLYQLDIAALKTELVGISHRDLAQSGFVAQVNFPHPDGTMHTYSARENGTLDSSLVALYDIHSYDANGADGSFVKWDVTAHGFHAMIRKSGESTIFIDPIIQGNTQYYMVYYKKDFHTNKVMDCSFDSDGTTMTGPVASATGGGPEAFGTCELRTYRLALSATGEYTTFHGGTVALALAAQVTTMNRVNGVYEKDMGITMNIIANNNLIIYTNTGTDPFTNGSPGTMINQNQTNTDLVIGNGNYDIGHVFGTNSGGLAGLGVVCNNTQKGRGVTGSGAPIGDPFDIDYVAHEIGHQFGANHTFNNSCGGNRNNATAMEPGSGSTIMAYAGICAPNIQSNSDDHFHGISLEEIGNEILSGGHTCELITPLINSAPSLISTNAGAVVPGGTPFALTAVATDPDGDPMTYNWEQMDNGISTQAPVAASTIGPNFRSNSSLLSPTRYFPNLTDLANGGPFTWEVVPTVSRTMNFRVTVRDNAPGPGGCNDHLDVSVTVDGNSGPFIVTYPSISGISWAGASTETVTWSVAGTDVAPVSCANVDILLSTDGGITFPTVLASNVANDGSQSVTIPNIATTTARIMVVCSSGTFFDISDNNFQITPVTNDYTLSSSTPIVNVCQPTNAAFTIDIGSIGGYNSPVTLSVTGVPAGATSTFSSSPVTPAGTSTLTISNTGSAAPGSYVLTVQGVSLSGTKTVDVNLNISVGAPTVPVLTSPANLAVAVSVPSTFVWGASSGLGITYEIDIAADVAFTSIVDQATGLTATTYSSAGLLPTTTYYWRVRAMTGCGTSAWSTISSFTTSSCSILASTDVGQSTNVASFTSVINVATAGSVTDINVPVFDMSHPYVGDIRVELTSPTGTVVSLFDRPGYTGTGFGCNGDDMDVSFDDAAVSTAADLETTCNGTAPTISGAYQSIDVLSGFNGESVTGAWTLTVYDDYLAGDVGTLNAWSLEICAATACNNPDVPAVSGMNSVCAGNSTTLSIGSGNLNDAIDWNWYSGSCGGTLVGTGSTLSVNPSVTTSYFVRGEGGCVVPGACVQFDVSVNPTYNSTESVQICNGQTHVYPDGSNGTVSEVHTSTLTSAQGCDSIIVTTLTVAPTYSSTESIQICNGQTHTYPDGASGTGSEVHTSTLTSAQGCDSIIVTTLTVDPTYNSTESVQICNGQTHVYPDGSNGTISEVHTSTLTSAQGCDSIIVTTLTVDPTYSSTESIQICNGQTHTYPDGASGTVSETHTSTLSSAQGCDSIIVTTLTVNPVYNSTETVQICSGQSHTYPDGSTGTNSDVYTSTLTSVQGCDSIIVTTLTVLSSFNTTADAAICAGDIYTFPDGSTSSTAQTQTSTLTSVGGCDSIVVTTLTVTNVDVSVTQASPTLTSNATGAAYQWLDCDAGNAPIAGATNASYTASAVIGNYAVEVTQNTCVDTSTCYLINQTGIGELTANNVLVYPNPTSGLVSVIWEGSIKYIELTDVRGRLLSRVDVSEVNETQFNVAAYSSGVYLVHVVGDNGKAIFNLIKQ